MVLKGVFFSVAKFPRLSLLRMYKQRFEGKQRPFTDILVTELLFLSPMKNLKSQGFLSLQFSSDDVVVLRTELC